jgi:NADPH:quinone reductase-like Zn-dependent oxidoreductase
MAAEAIPKKHKACMYSDPGKVAIRVGEVDTPEPGPGQVLIRLYARNVELSRTYADSKQHSLRRLPF